MSSKTLIGLECPALAKEKDDDEEEANPWPAAKHLQVTMVRGMAWHWKQLVAFDFTGNLFFF
jgi:hypothetical protein